MGGLLGAEEGHYRPLLTLGGCVGGPLFLGFQRFKELGVLAGGGAHRPEHGREQNGTLAPEARDE